jgi:hypothetical protein
MAQGKKLGGGNGKKKTAKTTPMAPVDGAASVDLPPTDAIGGPPLPGSTPDRKKWSVYCEDPNSIGCRTLLAYCELPADIAPTKQLLGYVCDPCVAILRRAVG